MSDQNWYVSESRIVQVRKRRVWPWVLSIVCLLLLFGFATLIVVIQQMKGDQSLSEFLDSGRFLDSSRRKDVFGDEHKELIRKATEAYKRANSPPVVTDAEQKAVEECLRKMEQALRSHDVASYRLLIDRTQFNQQVLTSGFLSRDAQFDFQSDFNTWYELQIESSYCLELKLVRLEKEPAGSTSQNQRYRAYTWAYYPGDMCSRIVWLISVSPRGTYVYDIEWVETATVYSQFAARIYSAAYTGKRWENYVALFDNEVAQPVDYLREVENLEKKYPRSLYETVLSRLADSAIQEGDWEAAIRIADELSMRAPMPHCDWVRATAYSRLNRHKEAIEAADRYAAQVGEAPDTAVMRAQIYLAMGETERAGENFIAALLMNPDDTHLPWDYSNAVSESQWLTLVEKIGGVRGGVEASAALGLEHVDTRPMIAERFLQLARTADSKSSALFLLEARLAARRGDYELAERLYREGWERTITKQRQDAPLSVSDYDAWEFGLQSGWESCMLATGRLEEMVRTSLDPVSTFTNNTLDDGHVYVSAEELQRFVKALDETVAQSDDFVVRLELARHIARALLELKTNQPQAAWDRLWPIVNPDHTLTDAEKTAIDADWGHWQLSDWCAIAGARCGKIQESFRLKSEETGFSPFESMAYTADLYQLPDALSRIIRLQTQLDSSNTSLPKYRVKLHILEGRDQEAFDEFVELYNSEVESSFTGQALLRTHFASPSYWDQLFEKLPAERVYPVLSSSFQGAFSAEEAKRLVQIGEERQLPKSHLLPLQILISHRLRDDEQLSGLISEWMELPPQEIVAANNGFAYIGRELNPHDVAFDYLIRSHKSDQARLLLSRIESAVNADEWSWRNNIDDWRLALQIADGKVDEISLALDSPVEGVAERVQSALLPQWNKFTVAQILETPVWTKLRKRCAPYLTYDRFRDEHPISSAGMTLLFHTAESPEPSDLEAALRQVNANCVIEEISGQRLRACRVSTESGSYFIRFAPGIHDQVDRWRNHRLPDIPMTEAMSRGSLVQNAVTSNSWIEILADDLSLQSTGESVEQEFLEFVRALQGTSEATLWYNARLYSANAETFSAIRTGTTFDKSAHESFIAKFYYPSSLEQNAIQQRQREQLWHRLNSRGQEKKAPRLTLVESYGDPVTLGTISLEVVSWNEGAEVPVFLARTGDEVILPPSQRNKLFTVTQWAIESWQMEESP